MIDLESLQVLNELGAHVHKNAAAHGFHDDDADPLRFATYCANLHSEVSELWEAWRKEKLQHPCDKGEEMHRAGLPVLSCAEEELADILIRLLDTAHGLEIDMTHAVIVKDLFNQRRSFRHGGKVA